MEYSFLKKEVHFFQQHSFSDIEKLNIVGNICSYKRLHLKSLKEYIKSLKKNHFMFKLSTFGGSKSAFTSFREPSKFGENLESPVPNMTTKGVFWKSIFKIVK